LQPSSGNCGAKSTPEQRLNRMLSVMASGSQGACELLQMSAVSVFRYCTGNNPCCRCFASQALTYGSPSGKATAILHIAAIEYNGAKDQVLQSRGASWVWKVKGALHSCLLALGASYLQRQQQWNCRQRDLGRRAVGHLIAPLGGVTHEWPSSKWVGRWNTHCDTCRAKLSCRRISIIELQTLLDI
jgi:hypothetical protein